MNFVELGATYCMCLDKRGKRCQGQLPTVVGARNETEIAKKVSGTMPVGGWGIGMM